MNYFQQIQQCAEQEKARRQNERQAFQYQVIEKLGLDLDTVLRCAAIIGLREGHASDEDIVDALSKPWNPSARLPIFFGRYKKEGDEITEEERELASFVWLNRSAFRKITFLMKDFERVRTGGKPSHLWNTLFATTRS